MLEKLQKLETKAYMTTPCSGDIHDQRLKYSQNEWRQTTCTKESEKAESLTTCLQAGSLSNLLYYLLSAKQVLWYILPHT